VQSHFHLIQEELFYVIDGVLTVRELRADADHYDEYELAAGDTVRYAPGTRIAHQFENRSGTGARFLALSTRHEGDVCVYPDSGKVLISGARVVGVLRDAQAVGDAQAAITVAVARARQRAARNVPAPEHVTLARSEPPSGLSDLGIVGHSGLFLSRVACRGGTSSALYARRFGEEGLLVLKAELMLRQVMDHVEQRTRLVPYDVAHFAAGTGSHHQLSCEPGGDAEGLIFGLNPEHEILSDRDTGMLTVRLLGGPAQVDAVDYCLGA
jgi:uncharacterized cupin superfamily protein